MLILDPLNSQDVVTFTGSASTGRKLKSMPHIINNSIPFTMEADSLNAAILGKSVSEDDPEFDLFLREISKEMTIKAGQKCTAIRRILAPAAVAGEVVKALSTALGEIRIGNPALKEVQMGALASQGQRNEIRDRIKDLLNG